MSYLQTCLTQLMQRHGMKGSDITRSTGLDSATISRWTTGTQVSIRDEDLEKLLGAVAHTREEKAELIAARMRDVCIGHGSELIEIRIGDKPALRDAPSVFENPLPEKYAAAFRVLAKNMNDPDVRDLVLSIAGLLDRPDPTPDQKPNVRKPARVRKLRTLEEREKN